MKILGIKRSTQYSPNHINNDDLIFTTVVKHLEAKGWQIDVVKEDDIEAHGVAEYPFILTMARNKKVIKSLQQAEKNGAFILNSSFGIANCYRTNITRLIIDNHIPTADSSIISTQNVRLEDLEAIGQSLWIKRGDFHAMHKEDVSFARNTEEAMELLQEFNLRGIEEVVINENLKGDLVKFYGVANSDFFYWFYPYDIHHHKYQTYETINDDTHHFSFDTQELRSIAARCSQISNVPIYGGDAIIDREGKIKIIDFNDWPSFAPCRQIAATAIADYVNKTFESKKCQK